MERVETVLGRRGARWTGAAPLPGGDFPTDGFEALVAELGARFPWMAPAHARRLARLYGTRAFALVGEAETAEDMGRRFGGDLTEREVRYLMETEWAETAEDILWRRTKLGLRLNAEEVAALARFRARLGRGPARRGGQ
jgi:glycerol-3-phosphate dehydrogenase